MGRATLIVPPTDNFDEIRETELSDQMAMSYGKVFARTLPDDDGFVTVTLESGEVSVIGHDAINGKLIIRRLTKGR